MSDVTKDLLGAQTTVDAQTVDRAWARFCGAFGDGPDAPYPGMIAAFETHYGQSFRDKEWRTEAACWAAAWSKATARAEASLAEPKAHHQEPMTIRLDPNAPCRNALAREGKPYPKSNCQRCGTLMRPGWKCAEGVELGKPPMRGCELRDDAVGVFKP